MTESATPGTENGGALADVRVLDFTQMLSGPYCTMLLADQGAEVIKVESEFGDTTRATGPFMPDDAQRQFGGYFSSINRNKKSIVLDLKSEDGKTAVRRLVKTANVVVENFRAGVMERLGLGYEELAKENSAIVYAAIRGFGDPRSGLSPYASWPAYDVVAQAMGGLMGITGPTADTPMKVGPGVGDIFPGTMAAFGILAALHHARRTGVGQFLDVSMYDSVLALCERIVYQHSVSGAVPKPDGNTHPLFAPFGLFPTTDGWVAIAVPSDAFWAALSEVIGRPELAQDPRCESKLVRGANREFINEVVAAWTKGRTKAQVAEALGGRIPFGPVNSIADIFADPHVAAREMLAEICPPGFARPLVIANTPIRLLKTPGGVRHRPPYLGEHSVEILQQIGFSKEKALQMAAAAAKQREGVT
jgi:crotonobetainyl-CoA:carnitine CoA-transferase CaiB-like acyl-CoA transferase